WRGGAGGGVRAGERGSDRARLQPHAGKGRGTGGSRWGWGAIGGGARGAGGSRGLRCRGECVVARDGRDERDEPRSPRGAPVRAGGDGHRVQADPDAAARRSDGGGGDDGARGPDAAPPGVPSVRAVHGSGGAPGGDGRSASGAARFLTAPADGTG